MGGWSTTGTATDVKALVWKGCGHSTEAMVNLPGSFSVIQVYLESLCRWCAAFDRCRQHDCICVGDTHDLFQSAVGHSAVL